MIYEELLKELIKRKRKNGGYNAIAQQLLITPDCVTAIANGYYGKTRGMGLFRAEDLANAMGFDIVLVKRDEAGRSDPNP